MKKLSVIFLAVVLCSAPGMIFGQAKLPVKFGLKISPNIGWMNPNTKGYSGDGARMGCTIGFLSDFYFAENYAFSSGINFQFLNGKLHYTDALFNPDSNKLVNEEISRKYNFLYVEIPLTIKMKTKRFGKISYFGQIGLGTAFRLKATIKDELNPASPDMADSENFTSNTALIRESVLFGLGCEYYVDDSSRILLGISYSNALNNVLTGVNQVSGLDEKSLLNYFELNIGFIF
jgi:hypothetical protein